MKSNKDAFHEIREKQIIYATMYEDVFKQIPSNIREQIKDWSRQPDDHDKLMQFEAYENTYKEYRKLRKKLNDYKQLIREKRYGQTEAKESTNDGKGL